MSKPVLLASTAVFCLVAIFAGFKLASLLNHQAEIKDEGVRLSESVVSAAYQSFAGAGAARLKSDHGTYLQKARSSPPTREADWDKLTAVTACGEFWKQVRNSTDKITMAFNSSGMYEESEMEFASKAARVSMGVLAQTVSDALAQSNIPMTQQTKACQAGMAAIPSYEVEALRRVQRAMAMSAIPPEALAEQAILAASQSFSRGLRSFNMNYTR